MGAKRALEPNSQPLIPLPVEDRRVARCLAKAIDTFEGNWERAAEWMHTPIPALNNRLPVNVAQNEPDGVSEVLTILGRLEHGVYS